MKAKMTWLAFAVIGALIGAGGGVMLDRANRPAASESGIEEEALQAQIARLSRENDELRAKLSSQGAGSDGAPTLAGAGDSQAPSPVPDTAPAPTPAAPPGQPNVLTPQEAAAGLAGLDWKKWVPVLMKYGQVEEPDADLRKELSAFLTQVNEQLVGQSWDTATDLFRSPQLATQIAMAAVEHAGAQFSAEQRTAVSKALETSLRDDFAREAKSSLRSEQMAIVFQAIANAHARLAEAVTTEQASAAMTLLRQLMRDPGWSTIHMGSIAYDDFNALALQLWGSRAKLDDHERGEAARLTKDWWEKSREAISDAIRLHGDVVVQAVLREKTEDDPARAQVRAEASFAGAESALHAKLATLQAAADRAFFELWKQIPKDRQQAFDDVEPFLLLFVPR